MRLFISISLSVILAFLMGSCRTTGTATSDFTVLNGEWGVVEMNGNTLDPDETRQTFVFDTNQNIVSGNAGCNRISGRLEYNPAQKNIIRFLQVVSTRMACMDMTLENEFLQTIDKVVRYEVVGSGRIALYGASNNRLFVLQKR